MAEAGCNVFAFDPAQSHARHFKPNVTFYQYGLVSGIGDEKSRGLIHSIPRGRGKMEWKWKL